ncbi:uncharacterized protein LOC122572336 [Bombus pyrosoma]|uniref:uncharacterized protein LOC122572336 n=1 Tax=Bombus pyrosoma TaxID=396416 RepID=UPI001CB896B6|nr:uncharacterized protein LOC122572336 [Bombus pyrosoma]
MSSGASLSIEKLNKENYDTWKLQMEAILIKYDLWEYANGSIIKPEAADEASLWNKRGVWNKLKEVHEFKGPARKATLLKQLLFTKISDSENMSDHLTNFFSHVKLKEMDIVVADDLLSILLLYSISNKYKNFRCAIESRDQLPIPEALKIKLLEANSRHNSNAENDHQEALQVEDSNKHKRANQCLKKKNDDHKAQLAQVPKIPKTEQCLCASNIQDKDNQDKSIITDVSLNINMELQMEWYIDSGATSHMCCDKNCFESIEPIRNQKVKLANDKLAEIKANGKKIVFTNKMAIWKEGRNCHYRYL